MRIPSAGLVEGLQFFNSVLKTIITSIAIPIRTVGFDHTAAEGDLVIIQLLSESLAV